MNKHAAITLLGGTPKLAALRMGISVQAISKWPDPLPIRISDRVLGAATRKPVIRKATVNQEAKDAR